jgi:RNA polymerase sigma-70 factor (ECF subfamily)
MINFDEIYTKYSPQIFRVCMGYTNDADQAKDLTQETFISVWKNLSGFRNQSQISTWIFRIATNNCLRALEKSKRVTLTDLPYNLPEQQTDEPIEAKLSFLYRCIAQLEEIDRIIISLVLEDVPQADIATIVGLSTGNVRVKIYRIKEKLSIKFKAHGQFE